MKVKHFILGLLLCMSAGNAFATDVLVVRDVNITPDGKARMAIQGTFDTECKAFQLDIQVPAGITVSDVAVGFTGTDHAFSPIADQGGNVYRLVLSSASNAAMPTGDVRFATVVLSASGLTADTQLDAKVINAEFSDKNNQAVTPADVEFKVNVNNKVILDEEDAAEPVSTNAPVDIKVIRNIKAGECSTLCLPFDMSYDQVKAAFGDNVKFYEFSDFSVDGDKVTVTFEESDIAGDKFYANCPYIIKTDQNIPNFTVTAQIDSDEENTFAEYTNGKTGNKKVVYGTFTGTYHAGTLIEDDNLFLNGGKFWFSAGKTKSKAFRGYLSLKGVVKSSSAPILNLIDNAGTTGISSVKNDQNGEDFYNLNGQRVANPQKGLFIKNGKKVIVK